jgi:hypothetical protein
MKSPYFKFPKRFIPATVKVKRMSISKAADYKMFPRDKNSVFNRDLSPYDVLTILKSLLTLIILSAVTLKLRSLKSVSSSAASDKITIIKSNLFQLTCQ